LDSDLQLECQLFCGLGTATLEVSTRDQRSEIIFSIFFPLTIVYWSSTGFLLSGDCDD
jgi:hypothetical protein